MKIAASGICGSDLHLYHGRIPLEAGFILGHEFVGTVTAAGPDVTDVAVGDRVLGCFVTACGRCFFCRRRDFHKCTEARVFGHGKALGGLQGAQAEQVLVPHANLTLRRVPPGLSNDAALFAGDVMGTGFHAVRGADVAPGDVVVVLGLGPVGLCAVQAARALGAGQIIAVDTVAERLAMAERFERRRSTRPSRTRRRRCGKPPADGAPTPASTPSATPTRSTSRVASRGTAARSP